MLFKKIKKVYHDLNEKTEDFHTKKYAKSAVKSTNSFFNDFKSGVPAGRKRKKGVRSPIMGVMAGRN